MRSRKARLHGSSFLTTLAAVGAALAAAFGCRDKESELVPVGEPAARAWAETIEMPVLKLRIDLEKGKALFRDDGFFRGDLALHSAALRDDPECAGLRSAGRASEGMMASGRGSDGVLRAVVWAHAADGPAENSARSEGLRAAAAIRLGRRGDIENYFESRGLRIQMKAVSNDVLVALVELYALSLQGADYRWGRGAERQQAAQILLALGVGEK